MGSVSPPPPFRRVVGSCECQFQIDRRKLILDVILQEHANRSTQLDKKILSIEPNIRIMCQTHGASCRINFKFLHGHFFMNPPQGGGV